MDSLQMPRTRSISKALGLLLVVAFLAANPSARAAGPGQAGTLDPSFGQHGFTLTGFGLEAFPGGTGELAVASDGKLIALGAGNRGYSLSRYNPDGSLDQTFGAAGWVNGDFGQHV